MIRFCDFFLALIGLLLALPLLLILVLIGVLDTGSPLFVQERLGRNKKVFKLIKFRTMNVNSKSVATHLANGKDVTRWGHFLRKTKLDELPQLWNVLIGQMSLVGPRPNLPNQIELIQARISKNVYMARPGITGLAQVNGIDMSQPKLLAKIDAEMIQSICLKEYFHLIFLTVIGNGRGDKIRSNTDRVD